MAGRSTNDQRKALAFFQNHFARNEAFSPDDLTRAVGWSDASTEACLGKHACVFTKQLTDGRFRVTQAFRRYRSWRSFHRLVSQTRRRPHYAYRPHKVVRTYEFLLPLANEELLREALDALFYEDTIRARLQEIPPRELAANFPKHENEADEAYASRLVAWISARFGGYSVYHVQGRFRATDLRSRADAFDLETKGERYLVDETTAVARFIFPCEDEVDAERVHFFFVQFFVEAVLEVISGEDQIWMVESGLRSRVHIWAAEEE
jgi:hypothetical protein